jgi:exonuclease VII small subunit
MYNNILQTNNSEAYRFEKHIESLEQHIQQLSNANTSLNQ